VQSYGPAYRVTTPRLVLRCWMPQDAPKLQAAIDASLPELRRFMPWAKAEPEPLEAKVVRLRHFRGQFDLGQDFVYAIFDSDERECVGGTGLHTRLGPFAREIGYWIATPHTKKGLATEAASALVQVAFRVDGVARVEIRCDPDNVASSAVARKVGMKLEGTRRADTVRPDGSVRDTLVFSAIKAELDELPARNLSVQAFGAVGERLI
jgi:RimJ/RimL family protein N-acetyltransferase